MIIYWQNHVAGFVGAHRYLTLGLFDRLPQRVGVTIALIGPPRLEIIAMLGTTLDSVAMTETTLDALAMLASTLDDVDAKDL